MKDTVLLVEDDETLCELSQEMFKLLKTPLFVAQNEKDADKIFQEHHTSIAIVIFDMNLDNATGVEVFQSFKHIHEDFTAILASGMFLVDDKQDYFDLGFNEVISKPYNLAELKRIIKQYIVVGE
jgi:DNA-binding NtrC family response regulator